MNKPDSLYVTNNSVWEWQTNLHLQKWTEQVQQMITKNSNKLNKNGSWFSIQRRSVRLDICFFRLMTRDRKVTTPPPMTALRIDPVFEKQETYCKPQNNQILNRRDLKQGKIITDEFVTKGGWVPWADERRNDVGYTALQHSVWPSPQRHHQ